VVGEGNEIMIIQAGVVVAGGQMNALCWIPTSSLSWQYRCMFVPHSSKRKEAVEMLVCSSQRISTLLCSCRCEYSTGNCYWCRRMV